MPESRTPTAPRSVELPRALTVKELLQLKRDWRTTGTLRGMPVVLLLIYGYALSFDERVMLSDDGELAFDMVLSPGITRLFFDEGDCDMGAPALVFERMDVSPG